MDTGAWIGVITGLITGIISSAIVAFVFDKRQRIQNDRERFELDKQLYCRYLQDISLELSFFARRNFDDSTRIEQLINNEPIRYSFEWLDYQSQANNMVIRCTLDKLSDSIRDRSIRNKKHIFQKDLNLARLSVLRMKHVPWHFFIKRKKVVISDDKPFPDGGVSLPL